MGSKIHFLRIEINETFPFFWDDSKEKFASSLIHVLSFPTDFRNFTLYADIVSLDEMFRNELIVLNQSIDNSLQVELQK